MRVKSAGSLSMARRVVTVANERPRATACGEVPDAFPTKDGHLIIAAGNDSQLVYDILNRVESPANEFKRRQLPPTLIISRNAIGIGRRRPVTHHYRRRPPEG